jgi:UDP-N-acetyl-2-amino-2-deoxyglucuronate dehydrogenase
VSTPRKFALVGAGVIGKHHGLVMSQLTDRLELVAVADVARERAEELAAARGGRPYGSLTEALNTEDIDVVVVCTPTVISQHRFDPSTETTLAAIARGELGRLTSGIASIDWWRGQSYYDSGDWRGTWELDGGGALMNQGVHTVDLLVAALGRPVEVFAYTGTLAHERIEVEDVATGVVRFESGALGVLHATTAAYPGLSARLQVHGDRGSAVIDNDQLAFFEVTEAGGKPEEKLMGTTESRAVPTAGSDPGQLSDAHRLQYLNFLGALDGAETLRVDLETNRQSIGVITGAYESARTGQPVTLA